jgi:hypothetical protein
VIPKLVTTILSFSAFSLTEGRRFTRVRRHARQYEPDFRTLARFAIEIELAAQTIRDDAVDDMQAEAGAAFIAPRREERIEGFAPGELSPRCLRSARPMRSAARTALPSRC